MAIIQNGKLWMQVRTLPKLTSSQSL